MLILKIIKWILIISFIISSTIFSYCACVLSSVEDEENREDSISNTSNNRGN